MVCSINSTVDVTVTMTKKRKNIIYRSPLGGAHIVLNECLKTIHKKQKYFIVGNPSSLVATLFT